MQKSKLIIAVIIALLLGACGESKKSEKNIEPQKSDTTNIAENQSSEIPYMTFKSADQEGVQVCIQVFYPKDAKVWIDWNDNKQLDEGEKLYPVEDTYEFTDIYCDGYDIVKEIELQKTQFTIYGEVTHLYCPDAGITQMDISHNPYLKELYCHDNGLQTLDISKNKNLEVLFCANEFYRDPEDFSNTLKDLDISQNTNLKSLTLPQTIETKVFDFYPEGKELAKILEAQNLIPHDHHLVYFEEAQSSNEQAPKQDKMVFFRANTPLAKCPKEGINGKFVYFKSLGNNKYEKLGEMDDVPRKEFVFEDENSIKEIIWDSMEDYRTINYKVQDGKIIQTAGGVDPNAEGIYEVKNANEFLSTIASDRTIKIMAPKIDITSEIYNFQNPVKGIDWEGALFPDIENLKIIGGLEQRSEILVNDGEVAILIFDGGKNIHFENLRIGHSPRDIDCYAPVLALSFCDQVSLKNVELYGCGTQGIWAEYVKNLTCENSLIDHCSSSALLLKYCENLKFKNLDMKDNDCFRLGHFIDSKNISFENGEISNNTCENMVDANEGSKSIVFNQVKIVNNKFEKELNTDDESIVKILN